MRGFVLRVYANFRSGLPFRLGVFPLGLYLRVGGLLAIGGGICRGERALFFFLVSLLLFILYTKHTNAAELLRKADRKYDVQ